MLELLVRRQHCKRKRSISNSSAAAAVHSIGDVGRVLGHVIRLVALNRCQIAVCRCQIKTSINVDFTRGPYFAAIVQTLQVSHGLGENLEQPREACPAFCADAEQSCSA
eukprot:2804176-Amphidinium_carterae.1